MDNDRRWPVMSEEELVDLCECVMCADNLDASVAQRFLDRAACDHGFTDWIDAFHSTGTGRRQYRCIDCLQDCRTKICSKCGSSQGVVRKGKKHDHHWSRRIINTLECKICGEIKDSAKEN